MPLSNFSNAVRQFARAAEQPVDKPDMTLDERASRYNFVAEEFEEFREAFVQYQAACYNNLPDKKEYEERLFKETLDLLYTTFGFTEAHGWPVEAGYNRVHNSNMTKFGLDGKFIRAENGKVLKSPNYKKPVLRDLLA